MANDLLSALKVYLSKVTDGERTPAEIAAALNTWVRESGESIKSKIEEEVESSVSKMGFVKKEEFDRLQAQVDALKIATQATGTAKTPAGKRSAKGSASKKAPSKKPTKKTPVAQGSKKKSSVKKAVKTQ